MKLHPREKITKKAESDFFAFMATWGNNLTLVEEFQIITQYMSHSLKGALRHERHPKDPSKEGGLE